MGYLGAHAKIQNPSSLLSGRKATASERRKKRKKCQVLWSLRRLHSAARTKTVNKINHAFFLGLPLPLLLVLAGGGETASVLWTGGLTLPLLAGGGEGELKASLPLLAG